MILTHQNPFLFLSFLFLQKKLKGKTGGGRPKAHLQPQQDQPIPSSPSAYGQSRGGRELPLSLSTSEHNHHGHHQGPLSPPFIYPDSPPNPNPSPASGSRSPPPPLLSLPLFSLFSIGVGGEAVKLAVRAPTPWALPRRAGRRIGSASTP